MSKSTWLALLCLLPHMGFAADCGPATVQIDETVGSAKTRLECFGQENNELKQEISDLKHKIETDHKSLGASAASYNAFLLPIQTCMNTVKGVISGRGGNLLEANDRYGVFEIDSAKVSVVCQPPFSQGLVMVVSDSEEQSRKLSQELVTAIFGPFDHP